jgi:hypothetical protein
MMSSRLLRSDKGEQTLTVELPLRVPHASADGEREDDHDDGDDGRERRVT